MIRYREAVPADAPSMSEMLREIAAAGKRTRPSDEGFVRAHYVAGEGHLRCTVAVEDGRVLGLQKLSRARAGNEWGAPEGDGIIGTHVRPSAARRGIGRAIFERTLEAARAAGLARIEAFIGERNAEGLAYYEAMGFRTVREPEGAVVKALDL